MKSVFEISIFFCLSIFTSACSKSPPSKPDGSYQTKGVLQRIDLNGLRLVIAHDEIPNYMAAMTMAFEPAESLSIEGIVAGDAIEFSFIPAGNGRFVITSLSKSKQSLDRTEQTHDHHLLPSCCNVVAIKH